MTSITAKSAVILTSLVAGCGVSKLELEPGSGGIPPVIQAHLTGSCGVPNCHASGAIAPALDASATPDSLSALSTVNIPYVDFGNPLNSYLVIKILDPVPANATVQRTGTIMPPGGMLSFDAQTDIVAWVGGLPFDDTDGPMTGGDDVADTGPGTSTSTTGDPETGSEDASTGGGGADGVCSLAATDPGAVGTADYGEGDDQIPNDVGLALENNCSCHYTDAAAPTLYDYTGPNPFSTLADFQATVQDAPYYELIAARMADGGGMPPADCMMSAAELDLVLDWLDQGAPGNADYNPP